MKNEKSKKQLIIEAAMKIFCRDGFHKAKVSDIAAEAGIGKGTIYEYFDSKKHVFEEMMTHYADLYHETLVNTLEKEEHIADKFKRYILIEKDVMIKHGDLANIFMREAHSAGIELHKLMKIRRIKRVELIADLIQDGINAGIFREVNPYSAALTFIGSIHHVLINELFIKDDFIEKVNIDDLQDILLNGIKK